MNSRLSSQIPFHVVVYIISNDVAKPQALRCFSFLYALSAKIVVLISTSSSSFYYYYTFVSLHTFTE